MATTAYIKPSRMRAALRRHPWVYQNSVAKVEGEYANGDAIVVRGRDGKFLAHAFINDQSRLFLRLVSFKKKEPLDDDLLRARVRSAAQLRHEVLGLPERTNAYRLVHSEADGIPGLIVDRYADVLTYTCTALGTHLRLDPILDELESLLTPRAILELEGSEGLRAQEGLPAGRGTVRGEPPTGSVTVEIDGLELAVPLERGQKTGLFLDQRDNIRLVAGLAVGKRVLDACCYVGAFGLACAKAGAASCLSFDSSAEAVRLTEENAALNGISEQIEVRKAKLFRELRRLVDAKESFDLVVLDPPKFATSARDVERACKGYLDANLLALRLLPPGGLLLTCSCSHHVDAFTLEEVLRTAATRAGADLQVLEQRGASPDHPMDVHCPEGRYLKAFLIRRRA